jgi:hypothetical protein
MFSDKTRDMKNQTATLAVLLCCALGYTPAQAGCNQLQLDALTADGLSKSEIEDYCKRIKQNSASTEESSPMEKPLTNKCVTPQANCSTGKKVPVGEPCTCNIPYGTASGKTQ